MFGAVIDQVESICVAALARRSGRRGAKVDAGTSDERRNEPGARQRATQRAGRFLPAGASPGSPVLPGTSFVPLLPAMQKSLRRKWFNLVDNRSCHGWRALAGAVWLTGSLSLPSMAQSAALNFAPDASIGWYNYSRQFIAPASGPGPVQQDPERAYVSNDEFRVTGKQPTDQVADLNNPILQSWARDVVRKRNDLVLAGKTASPPHASCWPVGVPGFLLRPMTEPMYFIQAPKEVVMILASKQEIRHIYLTDRHSPDLKMSWYGESIGRYEGDTLVVDTVGIDDRTWVDGFGTPHSKQLHVVERFHLIEDGKVLQADLHVEDPGAFTTPWNAIQRFRQYEAAVRKASVERIPQLATQAEGPMQEMICADNPNSFLPGQGGRPVPQTAAPDF